MQLRLPLQDELGAAALPVEDRRLPLDHACRVELGRQACPVFLADGQPGRGALGALGRQHASSLERSYALVRRQRPPLQFLVHGILRRVGGAMHDEQGAEQRRAETRREDAVPCHASALRCRRRRATRFRRAPRQQSAPPATGAAALR